MFGAIALRVMRRSVLVAAGLIALAGLCGPALGQQVFVPGRTFQLPTGVDVKFLGFLPADKRANAAPGVQLEVQTPKTKPADLEQISDVFFSTYWGPRINAEGKTHGAIHLVVPGLEVVGKTAVGKRSIAVLKNHKYQRKGPGLWLPVGRPVPNWLKAPKGKKIRLSNGEVVWVEKIAPFRSRIVKGKAFGLNIRADLRSTGSRPALELARRFARERLVSTRKKHKLLAIYVFHSAPEDGFHFRPHHRAFVLRRSPSEFWLVQKFKQVKFEKDGRRASMIWYVPPVSRKEMTRADLAKEARVLHSQYGARIAEDAGLDMSIIMATWPASETGQRVESYGTPFFRTGKGEWRMK